MQAKDFENILGKDIPNAMDAIRKLEASLSPILTNISKHRSEIDPNLMAKYDEAMNDLANTKEKMKQHGNFDSK